MNKLVMHHRYGGDVVADLSGHGNHGVPGYVGVLAPPDGPAYELGTRGASVRVPRSPILDVTEGFRLHLRWGNMRRDYRLHQHFATPTLVAGHGSFALGVDWREMVGSVFHPDRGTWTTVRCSFTGEWETVTLSWDGISRLRLETGNDAVETYDAVGPIAPVGEHGIRVGEPFDKSANSFRFHAGEAVLLVHDPVDEALRLADQCCWDTEALDARLAAWREAGWDHARLDEAVRRLRRAGASAAAALRAADPAVAAVSRAAAETAALGLATGDRARVKQALGTTEELARKADEATVLTAGQAFLDALVELPWDGELGPLSRELCQAWLLPPEATEVPPERGDPPPGPDVDRGEGEPPTGWDTPTSDPEANEGDPVEHGAPWDRPPSDRKEEG